MRWKYYITGKGKWKYFYIANEAVVCYHTIKKLPIQGDGRHFYKGEVVECDIYSGVSFAYF